MTPNPPPQAPALAELKAAWRYLHVDAPGEDYVNAVARMEAAISALDVPPPAPVPTQTEALSKKLITLGAAVEILHETASYRRELALVLAEAASALLAAETRERELTASRDSYESSYVKALDVIGARESELKQAEASATALREALGGDTPWPVSDLLRRLAGAAVHLLEVHDCDAHGWEGVKYAAEAAIRRADIIDAALRPDAPVPSVERQAAKETPRYEMGDDNPNERFCVSCGAPEGGGHCHNCTFAPPVQETAQAAQDVVPQQSIEHELAALDAAGTDTNADDIDPCGGDDAFRRGAWFALKWALGQYPTSPAAMIHQSLAETKRLMSEGERWICHREAVGWPQESVKGGVFTTQPCKGCGQYVCAGCAPSETRTERGK